MILTYNENQRPKAIVVCGNHLFHNKDNRDDIPSVLLGMEVQKDTYLESISISEEDSRSGALSISMVSVDTYPSYIRRDALVHVYLGYEDDLAYRGPFKIKEIGNIRKVADGVVFVISADRSGDLYERVNRKVFTSGTYYSVVKEILDGVGRSRIKFLGNSRKVLEDISVSDTDAITQAGRTDLALLGELLAFAGLRYADNPEEFVISENDTTSENVWEIEYFTGAKNVKGLTLKFKERSPRRRRTQSDVDDTDPLSECQAELAALRGETADVMNESAVGFDMGDLESIDWSNQEEIDALIERMQPQLDAQNERIMENIGDIAVEAMEDIDFGAAAAEFDPEDPLKSVSDLVAQGMRGGSKSITEAIRAESGGMVDMMSIDPDTHRPIFFRREVPSTPGEGGTDTNSMPRITPYDFVGTDVSARTVEGTTQDAVTGSAGSASRISMNEVTIDLIFGHMGTKVSDKVVIRGAKYPFDGDYRVKKVAHNYSKTGFTTTLQVQAFYAKSSGSSASTSDSAYDTQAYHVMLDESLLPTTPPPLPPNLSSTTTTSTSDTAAPSNSTGPMVRIVDHKVVYEGFSE